MKSKTCRKVRQLQAICVLVIMKDIKKKVKVKTSVYHGCYFQCQKKSLAAPKWCKDFSQRENILVT